MSSASVHRLTIFPLAIELRRPVVHATHRRHVADPIVVRVELISGAVGYGETLPRPYVTGETAPQTINVIRERFAESLLTVRPTDFPTALEAVDNLPWTDDARQPVPAARAAVELALLDAYSRHFRRSIGECVGWLGHHDYGPPGSLDRVRVAAVLSSADFTRFKKSTRQAWWFGLRDFKVKVGDDEDARRIEWIARYLARPLRRGSATLRVDVNGAWSLPKAIERLTSWHAVPIRSVEQPLAKGNEQNLAELGSENFPPVMLDESLVTMDDAATALTHPCVKAFNIRLSKCGGFLPSLKIAHLAKRKNIEVLLGCMVGETSLLSAVARRLLELATNVRFVEGNYGPFLLRRDVVDRPLRFGFGGRIKPLGGLGWGVAVDEGKLQALCPDGPTVCRF